MVEHSYGSMDHLYGVRLVTPRRVRTAAYGLLASDEVPGFRYLGKEGPHLRCRNSQELEARSWKSRRRARSRDLAWISHELNDQIS